MSRYPWWRIVYAIDFLSCVHINASRPHGQISVRAYSSGRVLSLQVGKRERHLKLSLLVSGRNQATRGLRSCPLASKLVQGAQVIRALASGQRCFCHYLSTLSIRPSQVSSFPLFAWVLQDLHSGLVRTMYPPETTVSKPTSKPDLKARDGLQMRITLGGLEATRSNLRQFPGPRKPIPSWCLLSMDEAVLGPQKISRESTVPR